MENTENSILITFQIGRGGKFNNPGHKSYRSDDTTRKTQIENDNFLAFENEKDIVTEHGEEIADHVSKLGYDIESIHYSIFCEKYGNLGGVVLNDSNGNEIGDYTPGKAEFNYDEDGLFKTNYGIFIENCDTYGLELIAKSDQYKSFALIEWMNEHSEFTLNKDGNIIEEENE